MSDNLCHYRNCTNDAAPDRKQCPIHLRLGKLAQREARAFRRASGLCLTCGDRAINGLSLCSKCKRASGRKSRRRKTMRSNHDAFRRAREALGLCSVPNGRGGFCDGAVITGTFRCAKHNDREGNKKEIQRRSRRALVDRRLSAGLCTQCGWKQPPDRIGMFLCLDCTGARVESGLESRIERRIAGLCRCGTKVISPKFSLCAKCRKKERKRTRKRYADRMSKGICRNCSSPVWRDGSPHCDFHRVQSLETEHRRLRRNSRGAGAHEKPITERE